MALTYEELIGIQEKRKKREEQEQKATTKVSTKPYAQRLISPADDIAPVKKFTPTTTTKAKPTVKNYFEDGYDFGDVSKTILGVTKATGKAIGSALTGSSNTKKQTASMFREIDKGKTETLSFDETMMKKYSTMSFADIEKEYARIEQEEKTYKALNGGKLTNYLSKAGSYLIPGETGSAARTQSQTDIDKINELTREKEIINLYRKQRATEEYLGGLSEEQIKLLDNIAEAEALETAAPFSILAPQGGIDANTYYKTTEVERTAGKEARAKLLKQLKEKNTDKNDEELDELIDNMVELRKSQVNAQDTSSMLMDIKGNGAASEFNPEADNIPGFATEHPVASFLLSRGANLLGGFTGLSELYMQRGNEYGLDTNAPGFAFTNASSAIDEQIQLDHDWKIQIGEKNDYGFNDDYGTGDSEGKSYGFEIDAFDFFYKAGTGIIDNVARLAMSGGNSTVAGAMMFTQGTTQSIIAGKKKGYSDAKALTLGLLDGTFEAVSEKISLDAILGSKGGALKTLAKSFAAEGSEELTSSWLNRIADEVANGNHSELSKQYEAYINEGYTKSQALAEVVGSVIGEDFESFLIGGIAGAVMGGGVAISNAVASNKNTPVELREDEQTVVDKVIEDLIAEAKEDGTKITKKKEAEIRNAVLRALDRGGIDTEVIESLLGEEEYETYKKAKDLTNENIANGNKVIKGLQKELNKLEAEYDELNNLELTKAKLGDSKRLTQIEEQKAEIEKRIQQTEDIIEKLNNDERLADLKTKLGQSVYEKVKDSRLAESYHEIARNEQRFEADTSKYENENARQTVQKAIDSKLFGNSNKAHEFIDFAAKLSEDRGYVIEFTKTEGLEKLKQEGNKYNLKADADRIEAFVSDKHKTIVVNVDTASKAFDSLIGHEITHTLEQAKSYEKLHKAVKSYLGEAEYNKLLESKAKAYKGLEADIEKEIVADFCGERLLTDYEFVKHLSIDDRNVFQQIWDEIKYLCKIATAGSKEARELERVKRNFEKAYKESAKSGAKVEGTKNSLSSEQEAYFKDSKVRDENGNLKVMYHGTSKGGFTVFDTYGSNYGLFGTGSYLTDNKSVAEFYTNKSNGDSKKVYETYLNITNPIDMDAEADVNAWAKALPEADFSNCTTNEDCYRAMEDYFEDEEYPQYEASEIAMDVIQSMGYDGITHIGGGRRTGTNDISHQVYIAFEPEQIKNIDNIAPTSNPDIRYSLTEDSEGNKLTEKQSEYFANSKAVDGNGNLLKVYHTTKNDFTVFDKARKGEATEDANTYLGFFFSDDAEFMQNFPEFEGGKTESYYLDMKNPIDFTNMSEEAFLDIVEVMGGDVDEAAEVYHEARYNDSSLQLGHLLIDLTGEFSYNDFIKELKPNYDTLMSKGYDGVVAYLDEGYGVKEYIVLDSNQAKLTSNLNPTADADVRYSLSKDTEGRALSAKQRKYFADSKIKDANGNLKVMYHGSHESFTVFDKKKARSSGTYGKGFYFTDSKSHAGTYGDSYEVYLNITNPLKDGTNDITKEQLRKFVEVIAEDEDYGIENYGYGATIDSVTDGIYGKSDFGMLLDLNVSCIGNMVEAVELFNEVNGTDYDGIVAPTETVAFYPNQIKSVTNGNPTDNPDINLSLSEEGIAPSKYGRFFGKDILYRGTEDIAPIQPTASETEKVENAVNEADYAPMTEAEANAMWEEQKGSINSLTDADMPPEMDAPIYSADTTSLDKKTLSNIANTVRDTLSLSKTETKALQDVIQRYSTSEQQNEDDLFEEIKAQFGEKSWEEKVTEIAQVKQVLRGCRINVSPTIKRDIPDYAQFRKRNFGKILFANDGMDVDKVYMTLSGYYPSLFPDSIGNATDQLLQIAEVANMDAKKIRTDMLSDEIIREATELIADVVNTYKEKALLKDTEAQGKEFLKNAKKYESEMPVFGDDFAPVKAEKEVSSTPISTDVLDKAPIGKADTESQDDRVLGAELIGTKKSDRNKSSFASDVARNFISKDAVFETLSLKKKNPALENKLKMWRSRSDAMAQHFMENGEGNVPSLKSIVDRAKKTGLYDEFDLYLAHRHNVDRMKQGKAVFGDYMSGEMSLREAGKLQKAHPEFREWAKDVYKYNDYLLQKTVDGGLITQEFANELLKRYPNYIPIERLNHSGDDIRAKGVSAGNPIKTAIGGEQQFESPLKAVAHRTNQVFKAVNKNAFGVELKNTLNPDAEATGINTDDVLDGLLAMDEGLLQAGVDGKNPTFTVFENGERVTFEISEEMYKALQPTTEAMSREHKLFSVPSKLHKKVLTEYNLFFTARNFPKDIQEVIINSKHPAKTYANMPVAVKELLKGEGKYVTEYWKNGGKSNTYFEGKENDFIKDDGAVKKVIGFLPNGISKVNDFVEAIPRLAEYIASRKNGTSIEGAMLDAARVTTDFSDGGDITKFMNRNGFTFLNASVQGASQQVRNIRQAKAEGFKGIAKLVGKYAISGLPVLLFNHLMWDDDEEYEELSEYVKDNYYVIAKYGDGQFVRIPKGRTAAVLQEVAEQAYGILTGEVTGWDGVKDSGKAVYESFMNNIAPSNPIENNVIAPIIQTAKNKTWYGEDLVPTRLQDLPAREQFDEATDSISKWLGEHTGISPYKINYLLNQYSGFIGDMVLPAFTPEAERGDNSLLGNMIAPLKDQFVVDAVIKNRNPSDFYSLKDELNVNANSKDATDEDKLMYKYIESVGYEMGDLYKQKREIQNSNLSDDLKFEQVRDIQDQINAIAKHALYNYDNVKVDKKHARVGGVQYSLNNKGEWQKLTDEQIDKQNEVIGILGITPGQYWSNKQEYDIKALEPDLYKALQIEGISVKDYKENYEDWMSFRNDDFSWAANNPEKHTVARLVSGNAPDFRDITEKLWDIEGTPDGEGGTVYGSEKKNRTEFIFNLDIEEGAKYLLFKSEYKNDHTYNKKVIDYIYSRSDITDDERKALLEWLKFTVGNDGYIYWD